ncbi:MAG: DUF4198 domain-containing protein [Methanospirillum sp.]|uniref:DUF4198 domain-containing protein n=1 Tax=Methanospirillum sp. TaxID=45200 RepID=UPI00236ACE67|nr:DUF4198 domain-containing protein [Methanospirillum sp.]MDD1728865.1 DUF4198 domain-containing protein [Methanospirillum sp.]
MHETYFFIATVCLLCITGLLPASAHESWAIPETSWVNTGDMAYFFVGSSHLFGTSEELPAGYMTLDLHHQDGSVDSKISDDVNGTQDCKTMGYYKVFEFPIEKSGLNILDLYHTEGTWTHIVTNPPDTEGGEWINKPVDAIDLDSMNKTGWADDWYIERSYPKYVYSKTFIAGPDADFSAGNKPQGQEWEIVPLSNITTAGTGPFEVQVLYKGKPFEGAAVKAAKVGTPEKDITINETSNVEGKVTLNLDAPGKWVIKSDTGTDARITTLKDEARGSASTEKSIIGPVYRYALVLSDEYQKPEGE